MYLNGIWAIGPFKGPSSFWARINPVSITGWKIIQYFMAGSADNQMKCFHSISKTTTNEHEAIFGHNFKISTAAYLGGCLSASTYIMN